MLCKKINLHEKIPVKLPDPKMRPTSQYTADLSSSQKSDSSDPAWSPPHSPLMSASILSSPRILSAMAEQTERWVWAWSSLRITPPDFLNKFRISWKGIIKLIANSIFICMIESGICYNEFWLKDYFPNTYCILIAK